MKATIEIAGRSAEGRRGLGVVAFGDDDAADAEGADGGRRIPGRVAVVLVLPASVHERRAAPRFVPPVGRASRPTDADDIGGLRARIEIVRTVRRADRELIPGDADAGVPGEDLAIGGEDRSRLRDS